MVDLFVHAFPAFIGGFLGGGLGTLFAPIIFRRWRARQETRELKRLVRR